MKTSVSIVAAVLLAASVCGAQSELPDNAEDARKLRDAVIAWSQHLPDENSQLIDPEVLAPVAEYLEGQQWPDTGIKRRSRRMWGPATEGADASLTSLEQGASWLAIAFEVDRPDFVEQLATIDGAMGVESLQWFAFDGDVDTSGFDLERWSDEWHQFLIDTKYLERVARYSRNLYTEHINMGLGGARDMARLLTWVMNRNLKSGEFGSAMDQNRTLAIISRSCSFSGLLGMLTSWAVEGLCWSRVLHNVEQRSDEELAAIAEAQRQMPSGHYLTGLLGSHIARLEAWEASASADWEGYEDVSSSAVKTIIAKRDDVKVEIMDALRAELDLFRADAAGDHKAAQDALLRLARWDPSEMGTLARMHPKNVLMQSISFYSESPSSSPVLGASRLARAKDRAMYVVVALHRHKLAHDGWPDSLDVLVPAYLDELPMDPHDPERGSIRYRVNEDGSCMLWSVGPDGIDNGGAVDPESPNSPGESFDLVLWPTD